VFFIPLYTNIGYMAHREPWRVVNVESYGVRHWWNIVRINNPDIGPVGGTLRWGFKSDVFLLNVIYSMQQWDCYILDKVFDTLIKFNPLDITVDMPWMASGWTVGTWTNPATCELASKISFTLKSGIKWVNSTNGAILGVVTPEDVRFSFQYVYDNVGSNYPMVDDIYVDSLTGKLKIEIVDNTITFYESFLSAWALHWLGSLPIIPKFVYEDITDPHGFTPGNLGIEKTLIGSGPFYYVNYTCGTSALLKANRNYFKTMVEGVGGIVLPVDKFGLLAPYIGLASTILVATAATAIYVKRVKRRKEKQ
jgi:ABC-type transport system substrate-binding protein